MHQWRTARYTGEGVCERKFRQLQVSESRWGTLNGLRLVFVMHSDTQRKCIEKTRATPRRNFASPAWRGTKTRFSSSSANIE